MEIWISLFIALDYSYQMRIFVKKNSAKIVREKERKKDTRTCYINYKLFQSVCLTNDDKSTSMFIPQQFIIRTQRTLARLLNNNHK